MTYAGFEPTVSASKVSRPVFLFGSTSYHLKLYFKQSVYKLSGSKTSGLVGEAVTVNDTDQ
jgi:hypothetical protein